MSVPMISLPVAVINTLTYMPARSVSAIYSLFRENAPTLDEVNRLKEMALQGVVDDRTWAILDLAWHETFKQQRRAKDPAGRQELAAFRARLDGLIGFGVE